MPPRRSTRRRQSAAGEQPEPDSSQQLQKQQLNGTSSESTVAQMEQPEPLSERAEYVLKTRTEEKEEFAELNARLEFLLYTHRERDAQLHNERAADLEQFQLRTAAKESSHKLEVETLNLQIQETQTRIVDLTAELKTLRAAIVSSSSASASSDEEDQEQESSKRKSKVSSSRRRRSTRRGGQGQSAAESDDEAEEDDVVALREQIAILKQRLEALSEQKLQAIADGDDFSQQQQQSAILASLQQENDDLRRVNFRLRTRQQSQLLASNSHAQSNTAWGSVASSPPPASEWERLLQDQLAKGELERRQCLAQLKAVYEEKLGAYRTALGRFGHQVEVERSKQRSQGYQVQELRHQLDLIRKLGGDFRVDESEDLREELRQKNAVICHMQEAFRRKDEEFDSLMDVKIALDVELASIEALLNEEEQRMGWQEQQSTAGGGNAHTDLAQQIRLFRDKLGGLTRFGFRRNAATSAETEIGEDPEQQPQLQLKKVGHKRSAPEESLPGRSTHKKLRNAVGESNVHHHEDQIVLSFQAVNINGHRFHIQNLSPLRAVDLTEFFAKTARSNVILEFPDEILESGDVCAIFTVNRDHLAQVKQEAQRAREEGFTVAFWNLAAEQLFLEGHNSELLTLYDRDHGERFGSVEIYSELSAEAGEDVEEDDDEEMGRGEPEQVQLDMLSEGSPKDLGRLAELLASPAARTMSGDQLLAEVDGRNSGCVIM